MTGPESPLTAVLERSRSLGFLGTGPVEEHIDHARVLARAFADSAATFLDLGSGGGVPGLVIAHDHRSLRGVLLEGSMRRGAFLEAAISELGLSHRIEVWVDRAENVGRDQTKRARFDAVVARSFGVPAVVAECAAPLLRIGGLLIVSDPPAGVVEATRWPAVGLERLGLRVKVQNPIRPAHTVLEQVTACPDRFPRRVGVPAKRPIF